MDAGVVSGSGAEARSRPFFERLRFAVAVVLVGLAGAAFAIAFRTALKVVFTRAMHSADVVEAMRGLPLWSRVGLPAVGGLAAGLLGRIVARSPQGNGVGDVMEAIVLGHVRLSFRITVLKSIASFCAIVTGGSLGREGPLIQFGGASGKLFSGWLGLSQHDTRRLIAAGTAAGFAAAYNTPFAAVLFVVEVVIGVVVLDTVIPALVATVIAAEVTRAFVGGGPIYGQRSFVLGSPWELISFGALGLFTAFAAQGFMRLLQWGERVAHKVSMPLRPALGGLLAGSIAAVLPEVAGNGYEPLNALLDGALPASFILALLFAKSLATTASVSSGSPGGVFTPTLLIGGALGFCYGTLLASLLPGPIAPAGYALVGMAAATAATAHAPLMAAVMVFELSSDYGVVLPLAISTAVAAAVSHALSKDSIYGAELRARGLGWSLTLEGRSIEHHEA